MWRLIRIAALIASNAIMILLLTVVGITVMRLAGSDTSYDSIATYWPVLAVIIVVAALIIDLLMTAIHDSG